jgi:methylmalonyl-CoA mutase N-terminal domain/subunit
VQVALRTQQVLAYETGVPNVLDPLGGSWYVEALTDQLEREAEDLFRQIDEVGGVVAGLETGWFQRQIANSSMRFQAEVEQGRRTVVGVNDFVEEAEAPVEILKVGNGAEQTQRERLAGVRATRDPRLVETRLSELRRAAAEDRNIIPAMLDCARAYCTLYEIRHVLEEI